jgi:hypothetical protein
MNQVLGPSVLGPVLQSRTGLKVATEDEVWRRIGAGAAYVATPSGDALIASVAKQGRTGEAPSTASAATGVSAPLRRVARIGRYGDFDLMFAAAR